MGGRRRVSTFGGWVGGRAPPGAAVPTEQPGTRGCLKRIQLGVNPDGLRKNLFLGRKTPIFTQPRRSLGKAWLSPAPRGPWQHRPRSHATRVQQVCRSHPPAASPCRSDKSDDLFSWWR